MHELIEKLANNHRLEQTEYVELIHSWNDIDTNDLFALACETVSGIYGKKIYMRGLIEITNYCKNNCFYCGIRKNNTDVSRYRLNNVQIMDCCAYGYALGLRTFVLQGGEDNGLSDENICELVFDIKQSWPDVAVTLSLGEKPYGSYSAFRRAGADRYLLRHETADANHYAKLHPPAMSFENRFRCLRELKSLGYQVGAGFMVGSPGQTAETIADDLCYLQEFQPHMVGIGPFIPHKDTPFAKQPAGSIKLTLILLAIVRLILPDALLPATTALETLDSKGCELGILSGANVIMLNLTPPVERSRYQLYNGKASISADELAVIETRLTAIGYYTGMERGDHISVSSV